MYVSVLSALDLGEPDAARAVVRSVVAAHPACVPDRAGHWEPLAVLPGQLLESPLFGDGTSPLLWSNGKASSGSLWFGARDTHDSVYLTLGSKVPRAVVLALVRELADLSGAVFASAHVVVEGRDEYLQRYDALYPLQAGVTTHDLRKCLPDLAWATVLGPPFVSLFGRSRLNGSPAARVEWLGPDRCLILLAEPDTLELDTGALQAARATTKAHLGVEHFAAPRGVGGRRVAAALPQAISKGRRTLIRPPSVN